jgi:hypothetical protein
MRFGMSHAALAICWRLRPLTARRCVVLSFAPRVSWSATFQPIYKHPQMILADPLDGFLKLVGTSRTPASAFVLTKAPPRKLHGSARTFGRTDWR